MSNNIFEELPSRKGGDAKPMGDAAASIEKRARQLVYDARYEVKKMLAGKKADPATQERMVLQRIAKSTAIPAVKTRARQMVSKKAAVAEDFIPTIEDAAATSIAKAMFEVFVESVEEVVPDYLEELRGLDDKKYKIRVTDPKTGNSYVRYGTREKITQLRSKGLKVEMTEYGDPREGERKRGEDTARATGGGRRGRKRLDPVGKEDGDIDNDGDKDKSDAYLMKRRNAIGAAIKNRNTVSASYEPEGKLVESKHKKTKKTKAPRWQDSDGDGKWYEPGEDVRKEDFLWTEGTDSTEGQNKKQITGKGKVDNYASGAIKISPEDGSQSDMKGPKNVYAHTELEGEVLTERAKSKAQQRFMAMVYATKKGKKPMSPEVAAAAKGMTKKEAKKYAKTKHKGLPEKVEEAMVAPEPEEKKKDTRGDYAKVNLIKNKLRAMGAKNPVVMVACEQTGPALPGENRPGTPKAPGGRPHLPGEKETPLPKKPGTKLQLASYELDGKLVSDGYDSTYGRGERGEPKGTQHLKVNPEAWKKSMEQWKKLQPEIFDRPSTTPQAKAAKNSQNKPA